MRFREWMVHNNFVLDEMRHAVLPHATVVNGVTVDSIDFRFEDWKKGLRDKKIPLYSPAKYVNSSFSARLDDGNWLNVTDESSSSIPDDMNFATYRRLKAAGMPLSLGQSKTVIAVSAQPVAQEIVNPYWWRFVVGTLRGQIVKYPEWPRDDHETDPRMATSQPPVQQ